MKRPYSLGKVKVYTRPTDDNAVQRVISYIGLHRSSSHWKGFVYIALHACPPKITHQLLGNWAVSTETLFAFALPISYRL